MSDRLKSLLANAKSAAAEKLAAIDPKLVAAGVTGVVTYVVSDLLNLGLEDSLVDLGALQVSYAQAIAFVAAAVAGWWKANAATILRVEHESGNPSPAPVEPVDEAA